MMKGHFTKKNILSVIFVTLIAVIFIRVFAFEAFFVQGDSMAPTIVDGDYVLINKLSYLWNSPKRGDIVIALPRTYPGKVVKRVIGLPGERFVIENEKIVIKNSRKDAGIHIDESYLEYPNTPAIGTTETTIDPQEYFLLGDNRRGSIDSRGLGMVNSWDISGRVFGVISLKRLKYIGF